MSLNIGVDYKKTELTSSVRQVELAQRVYTQLVAAGIYLDAESKNRFFADAATIVDNTSFALTKVAADNVSAIDALSLIFTKEVADVVSVADAIVINVQFQRGMTDTVSVTDVIDVSLVYGAIPTLGAVYLNQALFG
tara:strand:- start:634 stop:1044 length:411 start_codon:yes stop_codon:yes gene_type:complete